MKKIKNKWWRPSKLNEDVIKKLEKAFRVWGSITQACKYAGISIQDYYNWIQKNKGFFDKMEQARNFPFIFAKTKIFEAMNSNELSLASKNALEFLRRRDPERKDKTETTATVESLSDEDKALIDEFFKWKNKE